MNYQKKPGVALNFCECIQVLDAAVDAGLLKLDPNNRNNILVYYEEGDQGPEGWYSRNLMETASEIAADPEEQKELLKVLAENGLTQFVFYAILENCNKNKMEDIIIL